LSPVDFALVVPGEAGESVFVWTKIEKRKDLPHGFDGVSFDVFVAKDQNCGVRQGLRHNLFRPSTSINEDLNFMLQHVKKWFSVM
jgi:hypothetical protein